MITPRVKEIIFVFVEAVACLGILSGPNRSVASLQNAVVVVVVPEGIAVEDTSCLLVQGYHKSVEVGSGSCSC